MTLNDLYDMSTEFKSGDTAGLILALALPEIAGCSLDWSANRQASVSLAFRHDMDWKRFSEIHTIWFDGKPVMAFYRMGRFGMDARGRFVSEPVLFEAMARYLLSLAVLMPESCDDPREDNDVLTDIVRAGTKDAPAN